MDHGWTRWFSGGQNEADFDFPRLFLRHISRVSKFEYATVVFDPAAFPIGSKLEHVAFNGKLCTFGEQGGGW
jgi:hypothetical protein